MYALKQQEGDHKTADHRRYHTSVLWLSPATWVNPLVSFIITASLSEQYRRQRRHLFALEDLLDA